MKGWLIFLILTVPTVIANDKNPTSTIDSIGMTQQILEHEGLSVYWNTDPFVFTIVSQKYPDTKIELWLPEVIIFDKDSHRGEPESLSQEWTEIVDENRIRITGRAEYKKQIINFEFSLLPIETDEIKLTVLVENVGIIDISNYAHLAICLSPRQDSCYSDKSGDRTYVVNNKEKIISISEMDKVGKFNHYPVGNLNDTTDSIQRSNVFNGFVARTNKSKKTTISFMWDKTARIDVNPGGLDCIHSHPAIGPLKPGETKVCKGRILIKDLNPEKSLDLMRKALY